MSRSGLIEFEGGTREDNWEYICHRGAVASAIRGKRGQQFLRDLLAILDAMPVKELAAQTLQADGKFCTIGAVCAAKGIALPADDEVWGEPDSLAEKLGVNVKLVQEVIWENDEFCRWNDAETPAKRWAHMREWVTSKIIDGAQES